MKIYLYEYNITPNIENRNILLINVEDNQVTHNDMIIENNDLVEELKKVLEDNYDTLLTYKDVAHTNYKGGRQRSLKVTYNDLEVSLIGNTDNNEIANFYNEFKEQVINTIEKYKVNN